MSKISRLLAFLLVALTLAAGLQPIAAGGESLAVVTTTSLLSVIAERIGGEWIEATVIIPPASCPGHFDTSPGDVEAVAKADVFLKHGWEGFAERLVEAAGNDDLKAYDVSVDGNWMLPAVQARAVDEVLAVLVEVENDPARRSAYVRNAAAYRTAIAEAEQAAQAQLDVAEVAGLPVLASAMQAEFVTWAGFEIVATYGRPEDLSSQDVADLTAKGKEAGAVLVIDNLQSGPDAGVGMAEEIGAVQLNLSNFPGGFEDTATWERAFQKNVDLLLTALED